MNIAIDCRYLGKSGIGRVCEGIEKLATDSALRERYGVAARERVKELFTKDTYNENIKKLVDGL